MGRAAGHVQRQGAGFCHNPPYDATRRLYADRVPILSDVTSKAVGVARKLAERGSAELHYLQTVSYTHLTLPTKA